MINVIADLIQSAAILCWAVLMISLVRRVTRLDKRLDQNSIAVAQVRDDAWSQARESQELQAICGCGHHQCFHDENGCDKKELWRHLNMAGNEYERDYVSCGCKRYTGPEQLPTVIP